MDYLYNTFWIDILILLGGTVTLLAIYLIFKKQITKNIAGKHVLVTGGSSGIGLMVSIECAKQGASVTIVARNVQLLEYAIKLLESNRQNDAQQFSYLSLDISQNYETVAKGLHECEEKLGDIYMLVNCAGMAICGVFEEVSIADAKLLMDINYFGTYYCTRYVLPKMKTIGDGIIVITASQAALMGIYGYGPYSVSKFALRGLAETIAMESRHKGVFVTLALPADTNTPGFENEEKSKPQETKIISGGGGLAKPEDVAKQILNDALKGSFFSILGTESWILTTLCCGMAPWGNIGQNILQAMLMGPLRIVGCVLQWHFSRIIKNCDRQKIQ